MEEHLQNESAKSLQLADIPIPPMTVSVNTKDSESDAVQIECKC